MAGEGSVLSSRILSELAELDQIVTRVEKAWKSAAADKDEFYFDSVALNLHSFYSGLERIFEKIAYVVDQATPQGGNWHQELLLQMSLEILKTRPAVLSENTRSRLEPYRGFRHVVRNVYSYKIASNKMAPLVKNIRSVFKQVRNELGAFCRFVQDQ